MTKKLMLGIFLVSILLLSNLAVTAERSSPGPALAKMDAVSSECDCLKKDKAPTSPGLKADVLIWPDLIKWCPPGCKWMRIPGRGWRCVCYGYPWR